MAELARLRELPPPERDFVDAAYDLLDALRSEVADEQVSAVTDWARQKR